MDDIAVPSVKPGLDVLVVHEALGALRGRAAGIGHDLMIDTMPVHRYQEASENILNGILFIMECESDTE